MNFNKFNKEIPETKNKYGEENAKAVENLASFSVKNNNPFYFEDFGSDDYSKINESNKIKKEILKDLDEEGIEWVKNGLEVFHSFNSGPIFTDSFHEDGDARENWKETNLNKLNEEERHYFASNRLRVNKWSNVIRFLNEIENSINNVDLKKKLGDLKNKIPHKFLDKYEDGELLEVEYNRLSDEEKIIVVKELTEIAKEAIDLLEEKQN